MKYPRINIEYATRLIPQLTNVFNSHTLTFKELGKFGGFGNQLWQIFSSIGIGIRNDKSLKFGPWKYSKYFCFPESIWHHPNIFTPNSLKYTAYLGQQAIYMQDLSLLPEDFKLIQRYLQPSNLIYEQIENSSTKYAISERHAVHIRRKDYLTSAHYHTVPSKNWFHDQLRNESLIFTDDIEWVKKYFPTTDIVDEDEITSWLLMSRCRSFTISASTYSFWAAYISGSKDVTYPHPWTPQPVQVWNTSLFIPTYFQPSQVANL